MGRQRDPRVPQLQQFASFIISLHTTAGGMTCVHRIDGKIEHRGYFNNAHLLQRAVRESNGGTEFYFHPHALTCTLPERQRNRFSARWSERDCEAVQAYTIFAVRVRPRADDPSEAPQLARNIAAEQAKRIYRNCVRRRVASGRVVREVAAILAREAAGYTVAIPTIDSNFVDANANAAALATYFRRHYETPSVVVEPYSDLLPLYGWPPEGASLPCIVRSRLQYDGCNLWLAFQREIAAIRGETGPRLHFATGVVQLVVDGVVQGEVDCHGRARDVLERLAEAPGGRLNLSALHKQIVEPNETLEDSTIRGFVSAARRTLRALFAESRVPSPRDPIRPRRSGGNPVVWVLTLR